MDVHAFLQTLPVVGLGMLGIFIVMLIILGAVMLLTMQKK